MTGPIHEPVTGLVAVLCVVVVFAFLLVGFAIEAGWNPHDDPDAPTPTSEAEHDAGQPAGHDDR